MFNRRRQIKLNFDVLRKYKFMYILHSLDKLHVQII